jgi:hypothetical protein
MTGHGGKFEPKKEEAIAALLTQRNVEKAARSHERTQQEGFADWKRN